MTCLGRVLEFAFGWLRVQLLPGVTPVNFAIYVFSVVVTISLFVFINANQPYTLSHIGVSESEKGAVSARLTIIGEMVSVLRPSRFACLSQHFAGHYCHNQRLGRSLRMARRPGNILFRLSSLRRSHCSLSCNLLPPRPHLRSLPFFRRRCGPCHHDIYCAGCFCQLAAQRLRRELYKLGQRRRRLDSRTLLPQHSETTFVRRLFRT